MFWTVFSVERRNLWRDKSAWAALVAFFILAAYAALGGAAVAADERDAMRAVAQEETERLAELRAQVESGAPSVHAADPRDPALVGRDLGRRAATLPPGSLAAVSVGQRDLLPHTIWVTTLARLSEAGPDDGGGLARRVTGAFDLAFVLVFLLPLVVIALCFDVLAAERERGTLALVLSQPVSLGTFVLAKALLRGLVLVLVVLLAALVVPLAVSVGQLDGAALVSIALYVVLLVAYTAFWFCLCLCVNAYGASAAGNALSLVSVWLLVVVVVPGLTSAMADTLYPSPSRVALVNQAREVAREVEAEVSAIEGDHGQPASKARDTAVRAARVQTELEERVRPVMDDFAAQLERQQRLVDRLRFLSPAIVAYEGLNDVAGSGVTRHQHFSKAVERYQAEYRRFFFERIERRQSLGTADYDAMPRFQYQEAPASELALRLGAGLVGLLLPALALLWFARVGFRRHLSRGLR